MGSPGRNGRAGLSVLLGWCLLSTGGCGPRKIDSELRIEFTSLPPAGDGSPEHMEPIRGRVTGAGRGHRVVLFARSGMWWVQPTAANPFTDIQADSTWKASTHPGSAYAALVVTPSYKPQTTLNALPEQGGEVLAVAVAEGPSLRPTPSKILKFGGYEWQVRNTPSSRGGTANLYESDNAWTDGSGFLHLRIARKGSRWTCAEVTLLRSLGYGSYRFVVRDVSRLEPAAVFSMFTWDDAGPTREMNIEVSRWGETASKNAQYVVQPYYIPANVFRYQAPAGRLTHWLIWEPQKLFFRTARGTEVQPAAQTVSQHVFTSGVASPGGEAVHMNLYVYDNKSNPLRLGTEVVVEQFEYLP